MATVISMEPRRDDTWTRSPASTPSADASAAERSRASPVRIGELYLSVWTPVLYESSARPVVSRSGNSSDSSSTGGCHGMHENGAGRPPTGSSQRRPCRKGLPGWSSSGHGHWMPPSSSMRAHDMPVCIGESGRNSSQSSSAVGRPQSGAPMCSARAATMSTSWRAWPGGGTAARVRWTRRSLLVTVPSDSAQPRAAGRTTSAISAVRVMKTSWTTMTSSRSMRARAWLASASESTGFSPMTQRALSSSRPMASNIWVRFQPLAAGIDVPQAASNLALAASSSTSWNPGSLLGRAPMSPPPWTLFWPRSGQRPEPQRPTWPVSRARLQSDRTLSTPVWCSVMPRVQRICAVGAVA